MPANPQAVCINWFFRNLLLIFYRMDGFSALPECPCSHRDVWRKTRYLWVKTRTDLTTKVECYRMNRASSSRYYPYGKVSGEKQLVSASCAHYAPDHVAAPRYNLEDNSFPSPITTTPSPVLSFFLFSMRRAHTHTDTHRHTDTHTHTHTHTCLLYTSDAADES